MTKLDDLKQKYSELGMRIVELREERRIVRELIKEACDHSNLLRIETDPLLVGLVDESDRVKYKCEDCYEYFYLNQLGRG